jgi:hypothetical protein
MGTLIIEPYGKAIKARIDFFMARGIGSFLKINLKPSISNLGVMR